MVYSTLFLFFVAFKVKVEPCYIYYSCNLIFALNEIPSFFFQIGHADIIYSLNKCLEVLLCVFIAFAFYLLFLSDCIVFYSIYM